MFRLSLDVPSTPLNELAFMKKADLPKIYLEINPLQTLKDQSQSNTRIKSTDLIVAWILLRMTNNKVFTLECNQNVIRKLQTGLAFASLHS